MSHCDVCNNWIALKRNRHTIGKSGVVCQRSLCQWAARGLGPDIAAAMDESGAGRALVRIRLVEALSEYETQGEMVRPLADMGLDTSVIADILDTTPATVRAAKARGENDG